MRGVTESMAGRAAVFQLLPMSAEECGAVSPVLGGFPEVLHRPSLKQTWFRSYIQTYLERDVRTVSAIRDLSAFRRFLALVASRCGQMLNRTEIAAPLGVSVPTVNAWLEILEVTGQIVLVPPFYENFGKRLVKSPKLYFLDSGLACHLLGIGSESELSASPFLGPVFEGFVASEIVKHQINSGHARSLYYFRDRQGLEVDFIIDLGNRRLSLVEAKATRSPAPASATRMERLSASIDRYDVRRFVVHRATAEQQPWSTLAPGTRAVPADRIDDLWWG
jgi:predicted AAA+ superfamily ATPase